MRRPSDDDWTEYNDPEIVDWKRVRSSMEHENELTNHRLTWLLTSQGFLLGAFALVFQASTKSDVEIALRPFYPFVLFGLAITGILACLYLASGLFAAHQQHEALEGWWRDRPKEDAGRHPPICGTDSRMPVKLPYYAFPFVFLAAWLIFLLVALHDYIEPVARPLGLALLVLAASVGLISIGYWLRSKRPVRSA